MGITNPLIFPGTITSQDTHITVGGHAANQAISAARCGAKVSLIGSIGNDLFGKTILDTLRREGINSSGIIKSDLPTTLINTITNTDNQATTILSEGASVERPSEQVPQNTLNEKTLLLLQNDIPAPINIDILKRAKRKSALSIMCFSHLNNIDSALFDDLDIMIINEDLLTGLYDKLGISPTDGLETLTQIKNSHCIILKNNGCEGACALSQNGRKYKHIPIQYTPPIDISVAFDAFCGSFAACIQAGLDLPTAIKYGASASALTSITKGTYNTFPYLGEIEDHFKTAEPKNQKC